MSNVVDLASYRRARAVAAKFTNGGDEWRSRNGQPQARWSRDAPATSDHVDVAAFRASLSLIVVDAETGKEMAGVPSIQCARDAPRDRPFWARLTNSHWLYVPSHEAAREFAACGTLREVRLVQKGGAR